MFRSVPFWILVTIVYFIVATWLWVCPIGQHCDDAKKIAVVDPVPPTPEPEPEPEPVVAGPHYLVTYAGNELADLGSSDHLRFGKDDANGIIPSKLVSVIDKLAAYLKSNANKQLSITGNYHRSEPSPEGFNSMGMGRADFFRQQLIQRGLDAGRVLIFDNRLGSLDLFSPDDTLRDGLALNLIDVRVATEGEELTVPPPFVIDNFASADPDIPITAEQRKKLIAIMQYLQAYPEKKAYITGHTSTEGAASANQRLGTKRADHVRNVFVQIGAKRAQLVTRSKGETQPVATPDTEEVDRRKNRRVEVGVIQ